MRMKSYKKFLIAFVVLIPVLFIFQNCQKMESQSFSVNPMELLAAANSENFALSCDGNAPVISLAQKSTGTINCSITTTEAFNGALNLSAQNVPAGIEVAPFASNIEVPYVPVANLSQSDAMKASIPVSINVNQAALGLQNFKFVIRNANGVTKEFNQTINIVSNSHRVNVLYLVPADRAEKATKALELTARYLQIWYGKRNNGKTFTLNYPTVKVLKTSHAASWYSTNPNPNQDNARHLWFFNNVIQEAYNLTGAAQFQPNDTWLIYVDAEPATTPTVQIAGGASGIAIMHSKDLMSVMGLDPTWKRCRGLGNAAHELGHAFYLNHPASASTTELMSTGFQNFPNATLTTTDLSVLNSRGFFQSTNSLTQKDFDCVAEE